MPTYEYHCSSCKSTYELRQGFDAATQHVCEECKKGNAKRVLHAPRVLFKGSGFYVTDSKGKSTAGATDAPTAGDAKPGDAKSDSKSDSKTESGKTESSGTKTPAKTEAAASSASSDSSSSSD